MTTCAEHALKAFAALLPLCKDRHSYLKAALKYCDQHIKDSTVFEAQPVEVRANLFFYPLKLACETKDDGIVSIALNAIQQLIAHGAVNDSVLYCAPNVPAPAKKKSLFGLGSTKEEEVAPTPKADGNAGEALPLVSVVVAAVCLHGSSPSEEVQVRVVRNLLMFVSYPDMGLHGRVLLSAINTSYTVFLAAKSVSVQATAKAALSQMVGIVQQRAEADCERVAHGPGTVVVGGSGAALNITTATANIATAVANAASAAAAAIAAANPSSAAEEAVVEEKKENEDATAPAPAKAEEEGKDKTEAETNADDTEKQQHVDPEQQQQQPPAAAESSTDAGAESTPTQGVSPVVSPPERSSSAHTIADKEESLGAGEETTAAGIEFLSENERDCFFILRSISKLSTRPLPEGDSTKPDAPEFRGKLQALNMLYHFIMTVGPGLRARKPFLIALRQYVSRSLLQSCMSTSIEIARVALNTMQRLACDYRGVLQRETIVFFYNILFPVLESSNSSFEHRFIALQIMESVLSDGQAVMDLFANYDCVVGGANLVNDLVNRCSKASQTSHVAPNWITPKQDGDLRIQAVRTLSSMAAALSEWVHGLQPPTPITNRPRPSGMVAANAAVVDASITSPADAANASFADNDSASLDGTTSGSSVNRMLNNKKSYEAVIDVFNRKGAKDGIALALSQGLLKEEAPAEVAAFLLTKGLDKVRIGEYLSPNKPHVKEILKAFINLFNFEGLEIDEAMRSFLAKFKIQGEAETVDRTMEQFAQRYCEQNPRAFSSPGTAYVLAFSIMMLNTDAHSVHVKHKMSLPDFHRTLRGIDDGKDLPDAFLDGIYTRITTREIKLEGGSEGRVAASNASTDSDDQKTVDRVFSSLASKKASGYKRETDSLVKHSLALLAAEEAGADGAHSSASNSTADFSTIGSHAGEFITADHPSIAKAFWEMAWTAVLPSLSFPMEESSNQQLVDCCLDGFDKALALTCIFNDATQREAFLGSLSGFTHLSNTKGMEYKNVKSIVTMMRVASREGDALEASWYDVLKCISSLDKLHILSHMQAIANGGGSSSSASKEGSRDGKKGGTHVSYEAHNAEIVAAHFEASELDRIFSRSGELSGQAVVYLIESLCRVSAEELAEPTPRTYSLQKLVEVAEINIGRMRYVWSQMWVYLSRHFISAGCNTQQLVAMYVVDSLRQLSIKFLARDELGSLGFQRDFMKPFEVIASKTPRPDIRELVVASLGQMVDAKGYNIMSGWHSVLSTLGKCSSAAEVPVVVSAAEVLHRITLRKLYLLNTTDLLTDVINAWSMLGGNAVDKNVALCAIHFIRLLGTFANKGLPQPDDNTSTYYAATADLFEGRRAQFITVQRIDILTEAECAIMDNANPNTFADFRTWLTVFAALSSLTSVPDHQVRLEAVTTLFQALSDHALVFNAADWEMITGGTMLPIFENIFCDISMLEQDRLARTATTPLEEEHYRADRKHHIRLLEAAFESYVRLYMAFHRQLPQHLPCLVDILLSCSSRNDPQVTNAGQSKLQILLCSPELTLLESEWEAISASVGKSMAEEVQVVEMLESSLASNRVHEATSTVHALVRTLMTISASLQNEKMPSFVILTWLKLFLQSHRCACSILDNPNMSSALRKVITGRIVLDLQRESCRGLVKCFGKVPVEQQLEIEAWVSSIIRRFSTMSPQSPEFAVVHEVVLFLLRFMCDMPDEAFRSLFLSNYGGLCALINNTDPLIRKCLSAAFLRLGGVLAVYAPVDADKGTMVLPEAPDLNTTAAPTLALMAPSADKDRSSQRASSVSPSNAALAPQTSTAPTSGANSKRGSVTAITTSDAPPQQQAEGEGASEAKDTASADEEEEAGEGADKAVAEDIEDAASPLSVEEETNKGVITTDDQTSEAVDASQL